MTAPVVSPASQTMVAATSSGRIRRAIGCCDGERLRRLEPVQPGALVEDPRRGRAGADGVRRHPGPAQLGRQRAHEPGDARLRGAVGREQRQAPGGGRRRDGHEAARRAAPGVVAARGCRPAPPRAPTAGSRRARPPAAPAASPTGGRRRRSRPPRRPSRRGRRTPRSASATAAAMSSLEAASPTAERTRSRDPASAPRRRPRGAPPRCRAHTGGADRPRSDRPRRRSTRRSASAATVAAPMPRAAPVTIATRLTAEPARRGGCKAGRSGRSVRSRRQPSHVPAARDGLVERCRTGTSPSAARGRRVAIASCGDRGARAPRGARGVPRACAGRRGAAAAPRGAGSRGRARRRWRRCPRATSPPASAGDVPGRRRIRKAPRDDDGRGPAERPGGAGGQRGPTAARAAG